MPKEDPNGTESHSVVERLIGGCKNNAHRLSLVIAVPGAAAPSCNLKSIQNMSSDDRVQ